jgi:pyridoxine 5-phosphate synthase
MMKLGVNIDHVATLRQARGTIFPDPVEAALICEKAGADSIVCHLREDRRHIQDADVCKLRKKVKTRLNLEMSIANGIVAFALKVRPDEATLVPERRQELTTEGGLDLVKGSAKIAAVIKKLKKSQICVSLFIAPQEKQIALAKKLGADFIELHTGFYADAKSEKTRSYELKKIIEATDFALSLGLGVNAGHGLNYENVQLVSRIQAIEELNIGHSIVAQAVFVGMGKAVKQMKDLIR